MSSEGTLKMLVVDDEEEITRLVSLYFSKRNYKVLTANSGGEAIKQVRENPDLDVILLDIMLPDHSGIELLEHFRNYLNDAAIIMVTGVNDLETVVNAMKLGADDYAVKPFRLGQLEEKIEAALRKRSMANMMGSGGLTAEEALQKIEQIKEKSAVVTFVFDDSEELNKFTEEVKKRGDVEIIDIRVGENYEISLKLISVAK